MAGWSKPAGFVGKPSERVLLTNWPNNSFFADKLPGLGDFVNKRPRKSMVLLTFPHEQGIFADKSSGNRAFVNKPGCDGSGICRKHLISGKVVSDATENASFSATFKPMKKSEVIRPPILVGG